MKVRRTSFEKKQFSYKKDCRNAYGENDKASRRIIRLRKKMISKSYRRTIKDILSTQIDHTDESSIFKVESKTKSTLKKNWKKHPDIPLGEYVRLQRIKFKNRTNKSD